jgi:divalent metal cation (Fe/Co/Zn/Cd) transporter
MAVLKVSAGCDTLWGIRLFEAQVLVRLPADMPLIRAHEVAHLVQERVLAEVPDVREVLVEPAPATTEQGAATGLDRGLSRSSYPR